MNTENIAKELQISGQISVSALDYIHILVPLREFILYIDTNISKAKITDLDPHDNICLHFASSAIEYAKAIYDNFLIGYIKEASILSRSFIENYVCLRAFQKYKDIELWKYWLVHSHYHAMQKTTNDEYIKEHPMDILNTCKTFDIEPEFLNNKIIRKDYGWIWKISNALSFKDLCNLIQPSVYVDYKMLCDFSHGTSILQNFHSFTERVYTIYVLSIVFLYLKLLINMCFPDIVDGLFFILSCRLDSLFESYINSND